MTNNDTNKKKSATSSTPAWHIGAEAFIALLIILIVPLAVNIKSTVSAVVSSTHLTTTAPKKVVVEPQNKTTLTKFLAAAVFGVNPDTNVVEDPETGHEVIILPYGGETASGGVLPGSGNVDVDRWSGSAPATDGSIPEIRKSSQLRNIGGDITTGDLNAGGNTNAGGNVGTGGTISTGGNITAGGTIKSGGTI